MLFWQILSTEKWHSWAFFLWNKSLFPDDHIFYFFLFDRQNSISRLYGSSVWWISTENIRTNFLYTGHFCWFWSTCCVFYILNWARQSTFEIFHWIGIFGLWFLDTAFRKYFWENSVGFLGTHSRTTLSSLSECRLLNSWTKIGHQRSSSHFHFWQSEFLAGKADRIILELRLCCHILIWVFNFMISSDWMYRVIYSAVLLVALMSNRWAQQVISAAHEKLKRVIFFESFVKQDLHRWLTG